MTSEFEPVPNEETLPNVNPHTEEKVSADILPANRSSFLSAPENQPFRELLLEFDKYFERWHRTLSAPEYLIEHTEDLLEDRKKKEKETWLRGFDIVQSGAYLQVVPLTKKQQEHPEGGVVRVTSESQVRPIYSGFPYDNFFVPVGHELVEIATLTDPESNLPVESFYVLLENLQEQGSAFIDPYNNQLLTSFYLTADRDDFRRFNPTQQKYRIHISSQTYDAKAHRMRYYSVGYALRKNRLSVKRTPGTTFLSPDHTKALLDLVDSLMPQSTMIISNEETPEA